MKGKIFYIIIALALAAFIGYKYVYHDHRSISEEKPEYVIQAEDVVREFQENFKAAETNFLNQTIVIEGKITGLTKNTMTVNKSVFCQFLEPVKNVQLGSDVGVKGRCIGYDDLLGQVKLDQCTIIK